MEKQRKIQHLKIPPGGSQKENQPAKDWKHPVLWPGNQTHHAALPA